MPPSIALFTFITVIIAYAASRAKAVPIIDDFSLYDDNDQLNQLLAFNDLPPSSPSSWQQGQGVSSPSSSSSTPPLSPLLQNNNDDDGGATQQTRQWYLSLDPCADPNVKSPPNCPIPRSSSEPPAASGGEEEEEEVVQPPPINTYGGSIQNVPMEYPWNICGGRNPEPRPIPTCSSGDPQLTVLQKADGGDSDGSFQLLQSFIYYPPPDMGCPNNNAELWCCWQFTYEEPEVKFSRGTGLNCINTNHMFRDITADVFPNHYGYGIWPGMKYVPVYRPGDPYRRPPPPSSGNYYNNPPQLPGGTGTQP